MSKLSENIKITPPEFFGGINKGEAFTSHGHKCTHCNGRGYFQEQKGNGDYERTPCKVCKGAGKLQAKIVIGWSPDDRYIVRCEECDTEMISNMAEGKFYCPECEVQKNKPLSK